MRGEHPELADTPLAKLGSSPHARGAQSDFDYACCNKGIIPACAGSTQTMAAISHGRWDHPRMRGEHRGPGQSVELKWGSSQHARGAR